MAKQYQMMECTSSVKVMVFNYSVLQTCFFQWFLYNIGSGYLVFDEVHFKSSLFKIVMQFISCLMWKQFLMFKLQLKNSKIDFAYNI